MKHFGGGIVLLVCAIAAGTGFTPQDLELAQAIAADNDPDPYQLGKGTPAEFISNRFYELRKARWIVRSGKPQGVSYKKAVRDLAEFSRLTEQAKTWKFRPNKITLPQLQKRPQLDGKLEPAEWDNAYRFFGEYRLNEEIPDIAGKNSRWYIGYADSALYVGAEFFDPDLISWSGTDFSTHQPLYLGDAFEVFLRPQTEKLYYDEYEINPAGKQWELRHKASPFGQWDMLESRTQNFRAESYVKRTEYGFCVEMRIPAKLQGEFSFLLLRVHRTADGRVWQTAPFPLLYDPHNIYGYCSAVLSD